MKDYLKERLKSPPPDPPEGEPEVGRSDLTHDEMNSGEFFKDETDGLWYGVKGMKWGQRKAESSGGDGGGGGATLTTKPGGGGGGGAAMTGSKPGAAMTSAPKAGSSKKESDKGDDKKDDKPEQPTGESSVMRYARVSSAARAGQAHLLPDADLQFFNARTNALRQVNQMFESAPAERHWMSIAIENVKRKSTQKVMSDITDAVAKRYIVTPIVARVAAPVAEATVRATT